MKHSRILALIIAVAAGAAAQPQPASTLLDRPARVGVSLTEKKLTLEEAVEQALSNNLEIQVEKTATATARQNFAAARGFWDPTLRFSPGWESRATPTASILQGAGGKLDERYLNQNFYFVQPLPWNGSRIGLNFENTRSTTTNSFTSFNPIFNSRLVASLTLPLLRNRVVDQQRTELKIRRKAVDLSDTDFELRVIDVILRVEQAYWDLVAARQDAQVKYDTVEWAKQQLAINQRMAKSGNLAPVEISAAEAELERRLDTYYSAVGTVTEAENNLKTLLAPDRGAPIWGDEVVPTDVKGAGAPATTDLHDAIEIALKRRPELLRISQQKETVEIQKAYANDQRKPQVDLVGAYVNSGLGGALASVDNPLTSSNTALYTAVNQLLAQQHLPALSAPNFGSIPGSLVGGYGTALSNLFGGNYQGFQVGLNVDFNFRNRTADANYGSALIAERRVKLERARAEQLVEAQVRNALQGIQTARQRRAAAEASARAAQEKLDSEMRLYQVGESTNFLVLTRQNEYADSRRRVVVAELDYNKSVSRLAQAIGMTLESHKINLK